MTITHDATKEMVAELRRMANRTGNKQAEKTMRDGATWLEDVENSRVELQTENDRLRQRIADKDEQLAGWKALLDAKQQQTLPSTKKPKYKYEETLKDFVKSGERATLIQIERTTSASGNLHVYPKASIFRQTAMRFNLPVNASQSGNFIVLSRTDITESGS